VGSRPIMRPGATKVVLGRHADLGDYLELHGREFITSITMPATAGSDSPGGILYNPYNSVTPTNTRLSQLASLYKRWEPLAWRYHFVPTVPTSQKGTLIMAHDPDPTTDYVNAASNLPVLRTMKGSQMFQLWYGGSTALPSERDYTTLWTNAAEGGADPSDERLSFAGQLLVVVAGTTGLSTDAVLGMLELEYVVRFYLPKLASDSGAGSEAIVSLQVDQFQSVCPAISTNPHGAWVLGATATFIAAVGVKIVSDKWIRMAMNQNPYEGKYPIPVVEEPETKEIKGPGEPRKRVPNTTSIPGGLGFQLGAYKMDLEIAMPSSYTEPVTYDYKNVPFYLNVGVSDAGIVARGGAARSQFVDDWQEGTGVVMNYNYVCMDGVARNKVFVLSWWFISNATGSVDLGLIQNYNDPELPDYKDEAVWLGLRVNTIGTDKFNPYSIAPGGVYSGGVAPIVTNDVKVVKSSLKKSSVVHKSSGAAVASESKDPIEGGHDLCDIEDVPPPKYCPLPGWALGSAIGDRPLRRESRPAPWVKCPDTPVVPGGGVPTSTSSRADGLPRPATSLPARSS